MKTVRTRVEEEMELEDKEDRGPAVPTFAHIGPTVRKKLLGFDCHECQEYYQSKLEEGWTKDQILMHQNKCSRH